jgi:hypothetical protein
VKEKLKRRSRRKNNFGAMTFLRCFTLVVALFLSRLATPHHVVFEEIGEMAGTLSYVHAVVSVNISGLARAVNNFKEDVQALEVLYQNRRQPTGLAYDDWFNQRILDLFTLASVDADSMLSNINSLRESLPAVTADTHLPHEDHEYQIRRRSLSPSSAALSVL